VTRDCLADAARQPAGDDPDVDQILEVPSVFGDAGELHQVIVNL